MERLVVVILLWLFYPAIGYCQVAHYLNKPAGSLKQQKVGSNRISVSIVWSDSSINNSLLIYKLNRNTCKSLNPVFVKIDTALTYSTSTIGHSKKNNANLIVKGNIYYDVSYRSHLDTPFLAKDIVQHTLQTRLDFLYKEKYPFKLYITSRFSNSDLFRKYNDIGIQYKSNDFIQLAKSSLLTTLQHQIDRQFYTIDSLKNELIKIQNRLKYLHQFLNKPDLAQRRIEERERNYYDLQQRQLNIPEGYDNVRKEEQTVSKYCLDPRKLHLNQSDYIRRKDSIYSAPREWQRSTFDSSLTYKEELDSLEMYLAEVQDKYVSLVKQSGLIKDDWRREIDAVDNWSGLQAKMQKLNIPDSLLPKGTKLLASLKTVGIGRSVINYSDLTVQGLILNGFQVEYNPKYYFAAAIGRIDYRFREFIVTDRMAARQSLAMVRFGKGYSQKNHVYFTYYSGKREVINAFTNSVITPGSMASGSSLAGFSLESKYQLTNSLSITGEVAKSTQPYYRPDSGRIKLSQRSLLDFKDRANEAYSISANGYFPKSHTEFNAKMRFTGASFQSFSIFTTGASQLSWLIKIKQPIFKRQLTLTAGLQQNEYNNPLLDFKYRSSSMQANVQAVFRKKNWPTLTLGYYPASQLTKISSDEYNIAQYQTLLAGMSYHYRLSALQLSSNLMYSQFFNSGQDTGFLYYNSKNILINQYVLLPRFTLSLGYTFNYSLNTSLNTIENLIQFKWLDWLSIGGGIKYHFGSMTDKPLWGGSSTLTVKLNSLGEIQLSADKGFLPGVQRKMMENNFGRLTYYINL